MNEERSQYPRNFLAFGRSIGLKEKLPDFGVIHSSVPCTAAALFTRNNFPGNPIIVGKKHTGNHILQTIIVNSANANAGTGAKGLRLVNDYVKIAADNLGIEKELILPCSTGIIGRPLSEEKMKLACSSIKKNLEKADFEAFGAAIMTTDRTRKIQTKNLKSGIRITGIAKGAGMIEPDMATMLAYIITDAAIEAEHLNRLLCCVADKTFNRISVDGDTSTSDTLTTLANGTSKINVRFPSKAAEAYAALTNPFDHEALLSLTGIDENSLEFIHVFTTICLSLAQMIVKDGEGATKMIQLTVNEARDRNQALKIGRSVINSPLFKTAIHGADPNWGRIIMAIGKVFDEPIPYQKLKIFFGDTLLSEEISENRLQLLKNYMSQKTISITITLGTGKACETIWGCDLTEEYIRLNSAYTT